MQCNIDAKGKAARLVGGFITLAVGIILVLVILLVPLGGWWWWLIVGAAAVSGLFQIFEGWSGWCALRAMGIKTPV